MAGDLDAQVIIVGAGPGGATTAFFLAQAGVDVLLVDRATFPRDKICGDGICPRSAYILDKMGLLSWVEEKGFPKQRVRLGAPNGVTTQAPVLIGDAPYTYPGYLIPRMELDNALVRRAVDAGARLVEDTFIQDFERLSGDHIRVNGQSGGRPVSYNAALVVSADGGLSPFTRKLGLMPGPADILASRQYFEHAVDDPGLMEIYWDASVLPGYGWIFHVGNGRINAGIGMYAHEVKSLKVNLHQLLQRFTKHNASAREVLKNARPVDKPRGFPLRTDAHIVTPFADNVLLVGESAGLVHPMTGEGIGPSMICAELAAKHIIRALNTGEFSAAALAPYGVEFHKTFDNIHRSARIIRKFLAYPRFVNRVIGCAAHDEAFTKLLSQVIRGMASPTELLKPGVVWRILRG